MTSNTSTYKALHLTDGASKEVADVLAVEESLSIAINGTPYTLTMRTPGSEEYLVRGLLFAENIYRDSQKPVMQITGASNAGHITSVNVKIPEHLVLKDFAKSRNLISVSSCGMCGKVEMEEDVPQKKFTNFGSISASKIPAMFAEMKKQQELFHKTGGTHAAGAFSAEGELLTVQEDIGRHNAVDKVIGYLLNHQLLEKAAVLTVSGRVSYEIVSKSLAAGIPVLASVSAPSSMAVDNSESAGITLMAFCRGNKLTVYANPDRIIFEEESGGVKDKSYVKEFK